MLIIDAHGSGKSQSLRFLLGSFLFCPRTSLDPKPLMRNIRYRGLRCQPAPAMNFIPIDRGAMRAFRYQIQVLWEVHNKQPKLIEKKGGVSFSFHLTYPSKPGQQARWRWRRRQFPDFVQESNRHAEAAACKVFALDLLFVFSWQSHLIILRALQ